MGLYTEGNLRYKIGLGLYLEGKLRLKKNLNLIVGRKFMIVYSIVAKVTGEKRGAPERVWVQGG